MPNFVCKRTGRTVELVLQSSNVDAFLRIAPNAGVQPGSSDPVAAVNERYYLTDPATAQKQVAITNGTSKTCGATSAISFQNNLCEADGAVGIELSGLQPGQMYDQLLKFRELTCFAGGQSVPCTPQSGSGMLQVVLKKSNASTIVLNQVPVDIRPLQNWMSVYTARSSAGNTVNPDRL